MRSRYRLLLATVTLGGLILVGALFVTAFAAIEGTFSAFLERRMGWEPEQAAYAFALLGFVSALIQGGLIRRLVPKFGEPRLILFGLATATVGLAVMAGVSGVAMLIGAIVFSRIFVEISALWRVAGSTRELVSAGFPP